MGGGDADDVAGDPLLGPLHRWLAGRSDVPLRVRRARDRMANWSAGPWTFADGRNRFVHVVSDSQGRDAHVVVRGSVSGIAEERVAVPAAAAPAVLSLLAPPGCGFEGVRPGDWAVLLGVVAADSGRSAEVVRRALASHPGCPDDVRVLASLA